MNLIPVSHFLAAYGPQSLAPFVGKYLGPVMEKQKVEI